MNRRAAALTLIAIALLAGAAVTAPSYLEGGAGLAAVLILFPLVILGLAVLIGYAVFRLIKPKRKNGDER